MASEYEGIKVQVSYSSRFNFVLMITPMIGAKPDHFTGTSSIPTALTGPQVVVHLALYRALILALDLRLPPMSIVACIISTLGFSDRQLGTEKPVTRRLPPSLIAKQCSLLARCRGTEGIVKDRVTELIHALTLRGPSGGHCVELQVRPPISIASSGPEGPTACLP